MAEDRYDREREAERRRIGRRGSGSMESGESSWRREGRGGNGGHEGGERGERDRFGSEESAGWQGGEPSGGE
jgi:hypothetical protein